MLKNHPRFIRTIVAVAAVGLAACSTATSQPVPLTSGSNSGGGGSHSASSAGPRPLVTISVKEAQAIENSLRKRSQYANNAPWDAKRWDAVDTMPNRLTDIESIQDGKLLRATGKFEPDQVLPATVTGVVATGRAGTTDVVMAAHSLKRNKETRSFLEVWSRPSETSPWMLANWAPIEQSTPPKATPGAHLSFTRDATLAAQLTKTALALPEGLTSTSKALEYLGLDEPGWILSNQRCSVPAVAAAWVSVPVSGGRLVVAALDCSLEYTAEYGVTHTTVDGKKHDVRSVTWRYLYAPTVLVMRGKPTLLDASAQTISMVLNK